MSERLHVRADILIDGSGGPALRDAALLVEDGAIARVGPYFPPPEGVRSLATGTLLPGLVNAHVHLDMAGESDTWVIVNRKDAAGALAGAHQAAKTLRSGVTSVRDLGTKNFISVALRDAIARGEIPGPRVLTAGMVICMTGGHGWPIGRETDGPWDARKAVREFLKAGADCIKLMATGGVLTPGVQPGNAQLEEAELAAAIDEAHKAGVHCASHAIGAAGIKNALRAGIDSIEHGHLLDAEAIELFKQRGTRLVPTLTAVQCIIDHADDGGMPSFVVEKASRLVTDLYDNIRKAYRAGVTIVAGSDAGTPFNYHDNYAYELELMVRELGMPPLEAIHASTGRSADFLHLGDVGRLEAGQAADLLGVRGDASRDIRALREVTLVTRGGTLYAGG
ncbi:amidohydrolase family protein [bacterium]|nr:MAG: amidohydrolase family protein [bacterium]